MLTKYYYFKCYFTINSKNTDQRQIGIGTILIEAIGYGFELSGCKTWYNVDNKEIKADKISLKRKK